MPSTAAIALSGMHAARSSLGVAAHNIANLGTAGFHRQQVAQASVASRGVDVSVSQTLRPGDAPETDIVGELQAKNAFLANLAVFATGDRMLGSLPDLAG